MDFVSHRGITFIIDTACLLIRRLSVCTLSFDDLKAQLLKECFSDFLFTKLTLSRIVVQLKLKCWLKKPLHVGVIEAKEVYIQLSFEYIIRS